MGGLAVWRQLCQNLMISSSQRFVTTHINLLRAFVSLQVFRSLLVHVNFVHFPNFTNHFLPSIFQFRWDWYKMSFPWPLVFSTLLLWIDFLFYYLYLFFIYIPILFIFKGFFYKFIHECCNYIIDSLPYSLSTLLMSPTSSQIHDTLCFNNFVCVCARVCANIACCWVHLLLFIYMYIWLTTWYWIFYRGLILGGDWFSF